MSGILNVSIVMRDGMDETNGRRARAHWRMRVARDRRRKTGGPKGARLACGHSWTDGADSASA
ncbi:hypothetical protein C7S13_0253 [Burkholderia cepacia]|nr:hypothetical protein [Burkholderia cepacia]